MDFKKQHELVMDKSMMETHELVMAYIKSEIGDGNNPTADEISDALHIHKTTVHYNLHKLEGMGLITRKTLASGYKSPRTIRIVSDET